MRNKLVLRLDEEQIEVLSSALRLYLNWNVGEKKRAVAEEVLRAMEGHLKAEEIQEEEGAEEKAATEKGRCEIIKERYGVELLQRLGRGERLEFWAGFVRRKGEPNLFLCGVNPKNAYVASRFLLPTELIPELLRFLIRAVCNSI